MSWRVTLLAAVIVADLGVVIGLVVEELRNRRITRAVGRIESVVGKARSAMPSDRH